MVYIIVMFILTRRPVEQQYLALYVTLRYDPEARTVPTSGLI